MELKFEIRSFIQDDIKGKTVYHYDMFNRESENLNLSISCWKSKLPSLLGEYTVSFSSKNPNYDVMMINFSDEGINVILRQKEYDKVYTEITLSIPKVRDNEIFWNTMYRNNGVHVEIN